MSQFRARCKASTRGERFARTLEFLKMAVSECDRDHTPEEVAAARAACAAPLKKRQSELALEPRKCR